MESVVAALKDTPIPTILVIAGIAFLLLSIAGQLAGRIAVAPERQRWAAVIGGVLLIAGIALYVVPQAKVTLSEPTPPSQPPPKEPSRQPSPTPSPIQPLPSTPELTLGDPTLGVIPSLDVRVTELRFFEGPVSMECPPPEGQRWYGQRFSVVMARYIYTELALAHQKREQPTRLRIIAIYEYDDGQEKGRLEQTTSIAADQEASRFWLCGTLGAWGTGFYKVNVYINGEKAASGSFQIYK
jgi:hypothetical protein